MTVPTVPKPARKVRWTYGVTTCWKRAVRSETLEMSLGSLHGGGFISPLLFVDQTPVSGLAGGEFLWPCSYRIPVGPLGNWYLGLLEMYLLDPHCDYYAMFQDDIVCCRNLRQYLEKSLEQIGGARKGYANLYTAPMNSSALLKRSGPEPRRGWTIPDYEGQGALALVLPRDCVLCLLSSRIMAERPMNPVKGRAGIDGVIGSALRAEGFREFIHYPSLVQHTGMTSTIPGNSSGLASDCFAGEEFDAMELLK